MSMPRLIDADAADTERISCYYGGCCYIEDVQEWLDDQPTIDAEPVRHGYWETVQVWKDNPQTTLKCSVCKTAQPIYEHDNWGYCPFCGAMMDGGAK